MEPWLKSSSSTNHAAFISGRTVSKRNAILVCRAVLCGFEVRTGIGSHEITYSSSLSNYHYYSVRFTIQALNPKPSSMY